MLDSRVAVGDDSASAGEARETRETALLLATEERKTLSNVAQGKVLGTAQSISDTGQVVDGQSTETTSLLLLAEGKIVCGGICGSAGYSAGDALGGFLDQAMDTLCTFNDGVGGIRGLFAIDDGKFGASSKRETSDGEVLGGLGKDAGEGPGST
jgi:hypothetical protein